MSLKNAPRVKTLQLKYFSEYFFFLVSIIVFDSQIIFKCDTDALWKQQQKIMK